MTLFLRALRLAAAAVTLTACGASIAPSNPDAATSPTDVALTADTPRGDVTSGDGGACATRDPPVAAAACAALTELATAASARDDAFVTTVTVTPATAASCSGAAGALDRAARVRFTAPRGGRWRFTARGAQLWSLVVGPGCAGATMCQGEPSVRGEFLSGERAVDAQVERGEAVSVDVGGCPAGATCRYELRAQRVGALACDGAATRCAAPRVCAVDACDAERFTCAAAGGARLARATTYVVDDMGRGYVVGRAVSGSAGGEAVLMARWLDAQGRELTPGGYLGGVDASGAEFVQGARVPTGAVRGRLWFYDGSPDGSATGVDVEVLRWSPPTAGGACDDADFATRCGPSLRCDAGRCAAVTALEITRVQAWHDAASEAVRFTVEGLSGGVYVGQLGLALLDAAGATLASFDAVSVVSRLRPPSLAEFSTAVVLSTLDGASRPPGVPYTFRLPPGVARLRVTAVDADRRRSAPVTVDLVETSRASIAEPCDEAARGCAVGLRCAAVRATGDASCEPPPTARACGLTPEALVWAPTTRGATHALTGAYASYGGVTRCAGGKGAREFTAEFVAAADGEYVFEARDALALELVRSCDPTMPASLCERAEMPSSPTTLRVTAAMRAGERAPLTVLGVMYQDDFAVTVRVP